MALFTLFLSASSSQIQRSVFLESFSNPFLAHCGVVFNTAHKTPYFNAMMVAPRWIITMNPPLEKRDDIIFTILPNLGWLSRMTLRQPEKFCSPIFYDSIFYKPPFTLIPLKKPLPFGICAQLTQDLPIMPSKTSKNVQALKYVDYQIAQLEILESDVQPKDIIRKTYNASLEDALFERPEQSDSLSVTVPIHSPILMPWDTQTFFIGFLKGFSKEKKNIIILLKDHANWIHWITTYKNLPPAEF